MKTTLLVLASLVFGLLLCEAGLRIFTRYQPGAFQAPTERSSSDKPLDLEEAVPYIQRLAAAPGTDRRWFTENPPPLPNRKPVRPEDEARYQDYERRGLFPRQADYIWNRVFVESNACGPESWFRNYPGTVRVFDPPSSDTHPVYRFPPNTTTTAGLVTNEFGFRGPPLALAKPPQTVRVAFVGASTTINKHIFPFSYPERVVGWLNQFAAANRYDVRFEVLNAGREGINSEDFPAIVRYELLPLDPDLVVYYEGANQFTSANALVSPHIPPRADIDPRDPVVVHKVPELLRAHSAAANLLDLALNGFSSIGEPRKPSYRIEWPAGVDERNPNVDSPALPLQLPRIFHDLDSIRDSLAPAGGQLVVCSFEWFTPQAVTLSPTRHQFIYKQLNSALWPLRYADIRRLADFQNRAFERYAASRHLPFVDVASLLPQDPNLFIDAIHMTDTGERVKAWIVFQQLVPLIRNEIESGRLPRPAGSHAVPSLPPFDVSQMALRCDEKPAGTLARLEGALSIDRRELGSAGAVIEPGSPLKVTTPDRQAAYAAYFKINVSPVPKGRVYAHVRARVLKGQVSIAVLDQKNNVFMTDRSIGPSPEMVDIFLRVSVPSQADALIIRNAAPDGVRSEVLIENVELVTAAERKSSNAS